MERRQPSRPLGTNRTGRQRLRNFALGCALVASALWIAPSAALAANLVDVRVGEHREYTRVVLELDSLAAYQVSEPREGKDAVMRIELDARGGARHINVSDDLVSGVRVETAGKGSAIHVDLSKAAVQINEMILLSPPRLVFDIRDPAAVMAKRSEPETASAAERTRPVAQIEPEPAASPKAADPAPENAQQAAHPAIVPVAKSAAQAAEPVAESAAQVPESAKEPASTPVADGEAPADDGKPESAALLSSADSADMEDPATVSPSGADTPAHLANRVTEAQASDGGHEVRSEGVVAGGPLPVGAANAGRPNSLTPPPSSGNGMAEGVRGGPMANSASKPLAVPPLPSQRGQAAAAPEEPGLLGRVMAMVNGLNWMVLAGGGLVVLLLVVFLMRRGRGGEDALSPVMAAEDLGGDDDDLFGQPDAMGSADSGMSDGDSMGMEATEPIPTDRSAANAAPAAAPSAGDGGSLETRVAQLEGALAQLAQSRENIERQLAAQTEELRVQRAAIARTQRVVRSIGDGGEEEPGATEPVPRAPAS